MPDDGFGGRIGRYYWESEAWWPEPVRPPPGAPNVLVVLLDDVGFAQLGCFGSDIDTPVIDGLAAGGLRYTNFHTTALCSPTRACLLTGRNHHSNGFGRIIELAAGFPGYNARIPKANGLLSEMLVPHGYAAWAIGKWHLTPVEETHLGASRARWPLGRGFERFYGFMSGETHQYAPALFHDNHQIEPPRRPEDGYHLTEDLADRAIEWLRDLRAVDLDKPFFLYWCPGACHSPHQAPREWIERYRGRFDTGWDQWRDETFTRQQLGGLLPSGTELSPRPDWIPAWDEVPAAHRPLYARYMEAFAGFLSHTDHQIGRILDVLADLGELDNTLIFVLSDNGASSEGGPTGSLNDLRTWNGIAHDVDEALRRIDEIGGPTIHNNYPWGWTMAGNTPFRRWKRETHEGGVADPLIVHWPARISDGGGIRRQYVHVIDIAPTVLEAAGVDPPAVIDGVAQRPIEGTSFAYTFADANASDRHVTQYYEMFGCRAIYHDGWKAVVYHPIQFAEPGLDKAPWELYDVRADPSECHDLAAARPDKRDKLIALWWEEAAKYQVLPLDNRPLSHLVYGRRATTPERTRYVYWPYQSRVPEDVAADVKNRTHTVTAEVELDAAQTKKLGGVLVHQGNVLGGWALFVAGGELVYVHNRAGRQLDRVAAPLPDLAGAHTLGYRFERDSPDPGAGFSGLLSLIVDGDVVASLHIDQFTWHRFSLTDDGLTCGYATGFPVTAELTATARFTSRLRRVVVDVEGPPFLHAATEAAQAVETE
jgi:arylsulfatase A-like enzyme